MTPQEQLELAQNEASTKQINSTRSLVNDGVIRIGDRNPKSGDRAVIREDGSSADNGRYISNSSYTSGEAVQALNMDDGTIALDRKPADKSKTSASNLASIQATSSSPINGLDSVADRLSDGAFFYIGNRRGRINGQIFDDRKKSGTESIVSISISPTTQSQSGGGVAFTYTVTRSGSLAGSATVVWTVAGTGGMNAATAADFVGGTLPTGTLTFGSGVKTQIITIATVTTSVQPNKTFNVTLSNPVGTTIRVGVADGLIIRDQIINYYHYRAHVTRTYTASGDTVSSTSDWMGRNGPYTWYYETSSGVVGDIHLTVTIVRPIDNLGVIDFGPALVTLNSFYTDSGVPPAFNFTETLDSIEYLGYYP